VEFTQIKSPIAGRIGRHLASVGNLVRADDTLLTTVVSLDPIHCYFAADERAYLRYARLSRAGERPSSREHANPVRVALADEREFAHEGKMDFVDNAFDQATGTIQGRAILPNSDGLFAPGLFASVRLLGRSGYPALQIPETAIATNQSQRFVFVVEGGRAVYRPIRPGRLLDGLRVVDGGLREGDRVVVRGHQRLREGDAVRVQVEDPAGTSERAR
jgi:RND family efflux transporter MFP subunit